MFAASLIRLEAVGKTAESGNRHGLFYRRNNPNVNACSEITVSRPLEREFKSGKQDAGNRFQLESSPIFLSSLEIFLCPSVDAIERFLDVLDRVRHAKAKITFAEVAERRAGQCSDTCVLEERVGQLF